MLEPATYGRARRRGALLAERLRPGQQRGCIVTVPTTAPAHVAAAPLGAMRELRAERGLADTWFARHRDDRQLASEGALVRSPQCVQLSPSTNEWDFRSWSIA